ncbi:hypothetical protein NIES593_09620 [Hydrococcus rivularis NIES-593]|uniref:GUN4 domain-containing protein n=1 Tax=Hydrococcus rivularis NIES-593 TaxID=1921803 RepID=A0A1U7HIU0_9CYAN|nr:GUN4 domain-containing protein [Hydrococcus rivularis]OKH23479.1 hypothetical protein NIES593_09620 [Hydrococcus rivularis NIES-593]
MSDQHNSSAQGTIDDLDRLASQLQSESEKNQLQIVSQLINGGDRGLTVLMEFLQSRQSNPLDLAVGKAYQILYRIDTPKTQEFLQTYFPEGLVPLKSDRDIDYRLLQHLLAQQDFQAADSLTRQKLCELAGEAAIKRKWPYFTEVERFPAPDLYTLNSLWWVYSEGKFGFSVQRRIWLSVGKDFSKLWPKIGWKKGNNWTQYPNEFIWDLSAPPGHLPLLNQLRGVRVTASLFSHPVWSQWNQ